MTFPKTITIITSYPLNNEPVIRNRLEPFIHELARRDCSVFLVSPDSKPYQPSRPIQLNHVLVEFPEKKPGGFIKRALFEARQARRILKEAKKTQSELSLVTIPSMFLLFFSRELKTRRCALDIRDMPWEYLNQNSLTQRIASRIFRALAKVSVHKFDYVSVTTSAQIKLARSTLHIPNDSLSFVPNGVTLKQFNLLTTKTIKIQDNIQATVGYIGNLGFAQNLSTLVNAAKTLPKVKFLIAGEGNDYSRVKNYAQELEADNVTFLGRIDWNEIPPIYEKCSILYTQLSKGYESAIPSKLYEYLSSGKPVIYGGKGGEAESLLSNFEHCTVIEADKHTALSQAISEQLSKPLTLSTFNRSKIEKSFVRELNVRRYLDEWSTK